MKHGVSEIKVPNHGSLEMVVAEKVRLVELTSFVLQLKVGDTPDKVTDVLALISDG